MRKVLEHVQAKQVMSLRQEISSVHFVNMLLYQTLLIHPYNLQTSQYDAVSLLFKDGLSRSDQAEFSNAFHYWETQKIIV